MSKYIAPSDYVPPAEPVPVVPTLTKAEKTALLAELEVVLGGVPALREEVVKWLEARLETATPSVYMTAAQCGSLVDEWVTAGDLKAIDSIYAAPVEPVLGEALIR